VFLKARRVGEGNGSVVKAVAAPLSVVRQAFMLEPLRLRLKKLCLVCAVVKDADVRPQIAITCFLFQKSDHLVQLPISINSDINTEQNLGCLPPLGTL
jgi:hypothetical protein